MAIKTRVVSVAVTATRLDADTDSTDANAGESIAVYNDGVATVYLGGSDVTTATGVPVLAAAWGPSFDLGVGDTLYGIVASGTVAVRVLETGV